MTALYKTAVTSQLIAALKTLEQSMDRCDDQTWAADHIDTAVNQVVFHTLFFTDLYLNRGTDGFQKQPFHQENRDFFQDYEEFEDRPQTNTYDKTACREYLAHCIRKVRSVVESETETTLNGESGFEWRKCTRAELHIYNMRHIQHHAAQLGLRHQLLGGDPLKWVGEG
jgi:uncharacterized damage-inducible protein DinB